MGNACLGQSRKNGYLMRQQEVESRHQNNYRSSGKTVQAVAGQTQGNKLKIKLNLITCAICMQTYNITTRQPQVVCTNNHTYCKQCATQSYNTSKRCPECRQDMRLPVRNRDIYQLLEDNQQVIEQNKMQTIKQQPETGQIHLTINPKNQFIDSFWVEGGRVMKIDNNMVWLGFVSNESIPKDRESFYTMKIISSQFGNIQFGIVNKGYKIQQNVTCKQAVVYHLADARILSGSRWGPNSEWKSQGERIDSNPGTDVVLTCRINPMQQKVTWLQGDRVLGQGKFSEHMRKHELVAYVMICHKEDIIELNA